MRRLSARTTALLAQLDTRLGLWDRLLKKRAEAPSLIEQIGASGEVAAIPFLAPVLLDPRDAVAGAAAAALARLVSAATPSDFPGLDVSLRELSPVRHQLWHVWDGLRPGHRKCWSA